MDKLTQKFKRERDELREEMYRVLHADLWMAMQKIEKMLIEGTTANNIMGVVGESLVCDDATYHLYDDAERKLRNAHNQARRKAREGRG
jgi:hypothetical protein